MCSQLFEPRIPDNISMENFNGLKLHSHDYREPDMFKDRSVLVLGAGPSGTDIAIEISPLVKKVTTPAPVLYVGLRISCALLLTILPITLCRYRLKCCCRSVLCLSVCVSGR